MLGDTHCHLSLRAFPDDDAKTIEATNVNVYICLFEITWCWIQWTTVSNLWRFVLAGTVYKCRGVERAVGSRACTCITFMLFVFVCVRQLKKMCVCVCVALACFLYNFCYAYRFGTIKTTNLYLDAHFWSTISTPRLLLLRWSKPQLQSSKLTLSRSGSQGWCLNPKGLLNGTLYHPFGIFLEGPGREFTIV